MKTSINASQIKDILNRAGDRSGFAFDKSGPYFVNAERIKAMKEKFSDLVEMNADRITPRTQTAINGWFSFLSDRYGI